MSQIQSAAISSCTFVGLFKRPEGVEWLNNRSSHKFAHDKADCRQVKPEKSVAPSKIACKTMERTVWQVATAKGKMGSHRGGMITCANV
jgi:hypothetical protein